MEGLLFFRVYPSIVRSRFIFIPDGNLSHEFPVLDGNPSSHMNSAISSSSRTLFIHDGSGYEIALTPSTVADFHGGRVLKYCSSSRSHFRYSSSFPFYWPQIDSRFLNKYYPQSHGLRKITFPDTIICHLMDRWGQNMVRFCDWFQKLRDVLRNCKIVRKLGRARGFQSGFKKIKLLYILFVESNVCGTQSSFQNAFQYKK